VREGPDRRGGGPVRRGALGCVREGGPLHEGHVTGHGGPRQRLRYLFLRRHRHPGGEPPAAAAAGRKVGSVAAAAGFQVGGRRRDSVRWSCPRRPTFDFESISESCCQTQWSNRARTLTRRLRLEI
jgi:hypothetical protein